MDSMSRNFLVLALVFTAAVGGCTSDPGETPVRNQSARSGPESYQRGVASMELGNVRGALDQFKLSIHEHPDYLEAYWKLAECYVELGRQRKAYFEEAQAIYDQLASRVPGEDRRLLKAQARLHIFTWKIDEALSMYEEVLAKEPENCEFWTLYGDAQRAKASEVSELEGPAAAAAITDEALLSFERAVESCPDHFEAHEGIAIILTQRKLYDEVVVTYTDLRKKYPDEDRVVRMYTLALYRARDWAMAAKAFEDLLKRDPRPQDHLNYAAVLRKLERFDDSAEQVRLYEQTAPRSEGPEERTRLDILRDELKIVDSAKRAAALIEEKKFDEAIVVWTESRDRVRRRLTDPDFEDESRELLVWLERRIRYAAELKQKAGQ